MSKDSDERTADDSNGDSSDQGDESDESKKERIDRELTELLNELRVALPGVQVLFAFLLTVPFSQGFTKMTGSQRHVYAAALLLAAAATALLIAPSANHRLNFREGTRSKERVVKVSNLLAIAGLVTLMFSMATAVYLVMTVVFTAGVATAVAAGTIVWFAALWYLLPMLTRWRR
jgi:hypothetical protein